MTIQEQNVIMRSFRLGKINLLIATSVAEEGYACAGHPRVVFGGALSLITMPANCVAASALHDLYAGVRMGKQISVPCGAPFISLT